MPIAVDSRRAPAERGNWKPVMMSAFAVILIPQPREKNLRSSFAQGKLREASLQFRVGRRIQKQLRRSFASLSRNSMHSSFLGSNGSDPSPGPRRLVKAPSRSSPQRRGPPSPPWVEGGPPPAFFSRGAGPSGPGQGGTGEGVCSQKRY